MFWITCVLYRSQKSTASTTVGSVSNSPTRSPTWRSCRGRRCISPSLGRYSAHPPPGVVGRFKRPAATSASESNNIAIKMPRYTCAGRAQRQGASNLQHAHSTPRATCSTEELKFSNTLVCPRPLGLRGNDSAVHTRCHTRTLPTRVRRASRAESAAASDAE
jgi:hypothetical protein